MIENQIQFVFSGISLGSSPAAPAAGTSGYWISSSPSSISSLISSMYSGPWLPWCLTRTSSPTSGGPATNWLCMERRTRIWMNFKRFWVQLSYHFLNIFCQTYQSWDLRLTMLLESSIPVQCLASITAFTSSHHSCVGSVFIHSKWESFKPAWITQMW